MALAVERGARVSTLHLATALLESPSDGAKLLQSRGLRAEDLRSAGKVHAEKPGTFEAVQALARDLAATRAAEPSAMHLLVAALGQPKSALAAVVHQLGCDPIQLADEVMKKGARGATRPSRGAILHSGNAVAATAATAPATQQAFEPDPSRTPRRTVTYPGKILSTPPQSAPTGAKGTARVAANVPAVNAPGAREVVTTTARGNSAGIMGSAQSSAPPPRSATASQLGIQARARKNKPERTEYDLDPRTFPALTVFARNLSADNARGALDPVVGRDREKLRVLDATGRRDGRGALVVGPPGVGKSTLVRAIARETQGRAVLLLRHAEVCAQARAPQGAEKVRMLVEELVKASGKIIVALDPVAPWFTTRDAPDDVVVELRSALQNGKFAWIGTATPDEARKLGVAAEKLDLLATWHDAGIYSAREQAALAWTETLTKVADIGVTDPAYTAVGKAFNERETMYLTA
ncbi:MAG: AAA family ATPase, partial [Deltaproteobacteria bacterium]